MMKADLSLRPKTLKPTFYLILWSICCILLGAALGLYADSSLFILIVFAISGFLVFMAMDVALYLMLICLPFSFRYILPDQMEVQTPTEPLLGMLVFAFFIKQILARTIKIGPSTQKSNRFPFTLPILFYILATFLPTLNSPQRFVSIKGAIRSAIYMMSCLLAYELIRSRRDLHRLFLATFPAASVAVVWTVGVLIYRIDQWQWTSAYQGSPFTNYSVYGTFTAFFFLIVLSRLLLDSTRYDRVLWTGMLTVFGVGLMMCFSRGVWLSVIVAIGFILLQVGSGEQHKRILLIASLTVLMLAFLSLPGISDLILERISTAFNLKFASNRSRLLRWGQALLMFLQHPIVGNGYGTFAMLYKEDVSLVGEYTAQFQLGAHSEYLQVLAELGIIGFAAWLWVIIAFFRYGLRSLESIEDTFYRSTVVGLMAAVLALLVHLSVNNLLNGDAIGIPFWLIYGLLPAVVNIANAENRDETSFPSVRDANPDDHTRR
ncbi:MAG: O-antigen ligase family protein [Candidatus Poribacteria bacterium]|nr:O-antigen ligase family protein [Candidatus Poribacteria bacterium]